MPRFRTQKKDAAGIHRFKPPKRATLASGIKVWIERQEEKGQNIFYFTTNGQRVAQHLIKKWG